MATPDSAGQTTVCPYGLAFWESGLCDSDIETVCGLGYRLKSAPVEKAEIEGNFGETRDGAAELVAVTPRLDLAMQQATQRFRASLEQRLGLLEGAVQAVEAGTFSPQQQQVASTEAHKLAGGWGCLATPRPLRWRSRSSSCCN